MKFLIRCGFKIQRSLGSQEGINEFANDWNVFSYENSLDWRISLFFLGSAKTITYPVLYNVRNDDHMTLTDGYLSFTTWYGDNERFEYYVKKFCEEYGYQTSHSPDWFVICEDEI